MKRGIIVASAVIVVLLVVAYLVAVVSYQNRHPLVRWDWKQIDTSDLSFPKGFVWGVATSAHQVEGGNANNNWKAWEQQTDAQGKPRIYQNQKAGRACDHWNRYEQDIELMKELGVTAHRFSVEWSRIEPEPGRIDAAALGHYSEMCRAMIRKGVRPVVTLHHFTNPIWFEEMGAFEKEENIDHFVRFCEVVFEALGDQVEMWCTINEPNVYVALGYVVGSFPPGKQDPVLAAQVLKTLVDAHARVYRKIKSMPGGTETLIGLVKNIHQFEPYNRWNLGDWYLSSSVQEAFNETTLGLLERGQSVFCLPPSVKVPLDLPGAINTLDFIGVNYYSHINLKFSFDEEEALKSSPRPDEIMTDMDYTVYAEGLYRAVRRASYLGVPIYITENGIADEKDDRRALFIKRYLYALSKAIRDGHDVRGYFYWSLMDNFEWAEGYRMKFGLYEVDFQTQERRLREGAKAYQEIVRRFAR